MTGGKPWTAAGTTLVRKSIFGPHPGVQSGREHRAEQGNAKRAANRSQQHRARCSHAEIFVLDAVLHGEDEDLHHHAHAEAEPQCIERGCTDNCRARVARASQAPTS